MEEYLIHDNHTRPYCVRLENGLVRVWGIPVDHDHNPNIEPYTRLIYGPSPYVRVFAGTNRQQTHEVGNSVLVELPENQMLYVGSDIYTFVPNQQIREYISDIGNNDVPYPYAVGETHTYLMLPRQMIQNNDLQPNDEPYTEYYQERVGGMPFDVTFIEPHNGAEQDNQDDQDDSDEDQTNNLIVRLVNNAPP